MKGMKKFVACMLVIVMAVSLLALPASAEPAIRVVVDGHAVDFPDGRPYLTAGRVMVPVRFVSEALGGDVEWYGGAQVVEITRATHYAALKLGDKNAVYGASKTVLDAAPELTAGRTYVPLRFVSEALGAQVDWDETSATVTITSGPEEPEPMPASDKKVFALYHGFRRTREHDGELGTWKQNQLSPKSKTGVQYVDWNADLIDEEGNHEMASINGGPIVGMQSEIDPEYVEYKTLMAKIANIDGFTVDFGFPEYTNTTLLKAFQEQGQKYGVEVGVNWCDSWMFNVWLDYYRDDMGTRDARLKYMEESIQFLLDEVYTNGDGTTFQGHPIIYLFGGGVTAEEFGPMLAKDYKTDEGVGEPYFIRRTPMGGTLDGDTVTYSGLEDIAQPWLDIGVDVHSWIAPRLRTDLEKYPYWDTYATKEDVLSYVEEYAQLALQDKKANVNSAVVAPGFDNRGCAAWGAGKYHGFDREDGAVYREMWDYFNSIRDSLDVMFIASWSDFTEGHEIEPTLKNGYREMETTLEKAAEFKGEEWDEAQKEYLRIPEALFRARKHAADLAATGFDVAEINAMLDTAAFAVSDEAYEVASMLVQNADAVMDGMDTRVHTETVTLDLTSEHVSVTTTQPTVVTPDPDAIIRGKEVAQGKQVRASTFQKGTPPENAVDGIIDDDHRWTTNTSDDSYWLEINLGGEYTLAGADIYTGKDEGSWAVTNMKLQFLDGRRWSDIPGASVTDNSKTNTDIKWTFPETVTTSRVRLVCDEGSRGVRLREIKIYEQGTIDDIPTPAPVPDAEGSMEMENGLFITFDEEISQKLRDSNFEAYLTFEYFNDKAEAFKVTTSSDRPRPPKIGNSYGDFSVVADIKKNPEYTWTDAKVALYKPNLAFNHDLDGGADFLFKGPGKVKNIQFEFRLKTMMQ